MLKSREHQEAVECNSEPEKESPEGFRDSITALSTARAAIPDSEVAEGFFKRMALVSS